MGELKVKAAPNRATLARLDVRGGSVESLEVPCNPASYRLKRMRRAPEMGSASPGGSIGEEGERLSTELFLDTTGEAGPRRDARHVALQLRRWMDPLPETLLPPRVLLLWGPLRFVGTIAELEEEWIRFDADGTPIRGRLRVAMRGAGP